VGDNDIIMRQSDTGSGLAILDTDKYREDIETYLLDTSTYNQINENVIQKTKNQIKRILENMYYNQKSLNVIIYRQTQDPATIIQRSRRQTIH
jgi:hypothetical protein